MNYFKRVRAFFMFLFLLQSAWALDTVHFCMNQRGQLGTAKRYLSDILLADEFVDIRRSVNCLEVGVRSYRKEMLASYLRRKFKFRVATSRGGQISLEQPAARVLNQQRMCRIRFEQVIYNERHESNYQIGKRTHLKDNDHGKISKMESQLLLSSGIAGMIKINEQPLVVTCFVISTTEYRLQFSLGDKILSTVMLSKGQRINVGSVVSGGISSGGGIVGLGLYKQRDKSKGKTDYFMSIL